MNSLSSAFPAIAIQLSFLMFLYQFLEINQKYIAQNNDRCQIIQSPPGPDSMVIYNNTLIYSSFNKIQVWKRNQQEKQTGDIYIMQQNISIKLNHDLKEKAFRPLGLSIFNDRLFVINQGYQQGGESVLIFQIQNNWDLKLINQYNFDENYIGILGDVLALSQDEFIITTSRQTQDSEKGRQQDYYTKFKDSFKTLIIKGTTALYCKIGQDCIVQEDTYNKLNNGIVKDKKGRIVIANTVDKRLSFYKMENSQLKFQGALQLSVCPEKLTYDQETDTFMVTGLTRIMEHLRAEIQISMHDDDKLRKHERYWSEVLEIQNHWYIDLMKIQTLLIQEKMIRGATVAIKNNELYFVGSWNDDRILKCLY